MLLVAGGKRESHHGGITASTETYKYLSGDIVWMTVQPLPRAMIFNSGLSLNNTVFLAGTANSFGGITSFDIAGGEDDQYSRRTENCTLKPSPGR